MDLAQVLPPEVKKTISAYLIANPTAGGLPHIEDLEYAVTYLGRFGWLVEPRWTKAAGDAKKFAAEAVDKGVDVVIAAGGDGTINEVIQSLAGSNVMLGILPIGTVNVWARETGIPLDLEGALKVLTEGQVRRVDLGLAGERYFLLMASLGFDAEVTQLASQQPLKRLGVIAYLLTGVYSGIIGYKSRKVQILFDKHRKLTAKTILIVAGNTQLYGGAVKIAQKAQCDDGLLDVVVFRYRNLWSRLRQIVEVFRGNHTLDPLTRYERCKKLVIHSERDNPLLVQVDGDTIGQTPITIEVAPNALLVVVPQHLPTDLFGTLALSAPQVSEVSQGLLPPGQAQAISLETRKNNGNKHRNSSHHSRRAKQSAASVRRRLNSPC